MTPDSNSSFIAKSITIGWALSLLAIIISDTVIVAAQEYDFTSRGYDAGVWCETLVARGVNYHFKHILASSLTTNVFVMQ